MNTVSISIFLAVALLATVGASTESVGEKASSLKDYYHASRVEFQWESVEEKEAAILSGEYIPDNNAIAGIKVYNSEIYLTVPRWRKGVPFTLARLNKTTSLLEPFPTAKFNKEQLTYVQSMEIDSQGRMWILDVGRRHIFEGDEESVENGQPRLIVYDLEKGCVVYRYSFPEEVVPVASSFLNDLVLDEVNGYIYISSTAGDGGLIVFNYRTQQSHRFDSKYLQGKKVTMNISSSPFTIDAPSDGIALSPDLRFLYFCTISTPFLYRVPTRLLQSVVADSTDFDFNVDIIGEKGYSDGMVFDSEGLLYYGDLEKGSVMVWDPSTPLSSARTLFQNSDSNVWPDTFGFDEDEQELVWTANTLNSFFDRTMFGGDGDAKDHFHVYGIPVGANSYQQTQSQIVPQTWNVCKGKRHKPFQKSATAATGGRGSESVKAGVPEREGVPGSQAKKRKVVSRDDL